MPASIQALRSISPSGMHARCAMPFSPVSMRGAAGALKNPIFSSLCRIGPSRGAVAIRVMVSPCLDAVLRSVMFLLRFLFAGSFTVEDAGVDPVMFWKDVAVNHTVDAISFQKKFIILSMTMKQINGSQPNRSHRAYLEELQCKS